MMGHRNKSMPHHCVYVYFCLFQGEFHRTVVRTENLGVYLRSFKPVAEIIRYYEIVDTPACILLSCLEPVRPPRVDVGLIRVEMSECVCESGVKESRELFSFLICESCIHSV